MNLKEEIIKLKAEKKVALLAHYYVDREIQKIADYVGDSYYLSKAAAKVEQQTILFCGVKFMGESAKILNPNKKILMVDALADCPMAHMIDVETIQKIKEKYEDIAVVCYINSTAEIKAHSDVCVTSSNAYQIIGKLPEKNILFVPDQHLGTYISTKIPDKNFIFHSGYCPVHQAITPTAVLKAKKDHPNAKVLAHPECPMDVLELADHVGSTSEIIDYATKSEDQSFIICTEYGILHELHQKNPNKNFYLATDKQCCADMKLNTLQKIYDVLTLMDTEIILDEERMQKAHTSLLRMHTLGN